jgi:hypothetical protein
MNVITEKRITFDFVFLLIVVFKQGIQDFWGRCIEGHFLKGVVV